MALIVSIPDPESKTVGEMLTVDEGELGVVAEMATDPAKLANFGFGPEVMIRAKSLADANGDEHPEFPVVRVEEGWSNNHRLWDGQELISIAEQVNALEPVGHWGHIAPENMGWEAPDPQTTWVGALTKKEASQDKERKGQIVTVFYGAGYNLPNAKVRTYIKSRAVRGISWLGRAREIPVPGKGVQIRDFKLLQLDWARKLSEGMPTSSIAAIASEQEGGSVADIVLAAVTPEQFEKENPNGYALIVTKATQEANERVAEMDEKVKAAEADTDLLSKIRKALGIADDSDPLDAIAALAAKVGEAAGELRDKLLQKELKKRIPGDDDASKRNRELILRLLPTSEMLSKVSDCRTEDDADKVVSEMVEETFNKDDMVKRIIGEMDMPSVRRREAFVRSTTDRDSLDHNPYVAA